MSLDPTQGAGAGQPNIDAGAPEGRVPVVLQVVPRLEGGGVERGTIDMAVALRSVGWGAVVASAGGAMVRELIRHGATHVTMPLASKNPLVMRANVRRLRDVIVEHGVDIVHARSRAPAWSAWAAARRAGAHFITTFHGTYGDGNPLKHAYNAVMTRGERVIAISEFIGRHIQERYHVDPARLRVIHRGVDISIFDPAKVTQERIIQLARQWQLPDDRKVIMLPGRFSRWKGHALAIEALARLNRDDVMCVMIGADTGSRDFLRELENLARARKVETLLRFADFCRDMPAAYMLADVVLSAATRPEAFGRTLAEGLAMGRPAVGPNHGGAPEIIEEGRTGWLFQPGNAESMATALHKALSLSAQSRAQFAASAMRRVRENFSNARMCEDTIDLYSELLGAGSGAPAAG